MLKDLLKSILWENSLLNEINENIILYHRSSNKYKVGQILSLYTDVDKYFQKI
jgi:hypothetical protein